MRIYQTRAAINGTATFEQTFATLEAAQGYLHRLREMCQQDSRHFGGVIIPMDSTSDGYFVPNTDEKIFC